MPVSQHHGGAEPNVTPSMREPSEASITAPLFSSSNLVPASENVPVDLRPDEGENRDAFVQALDAFPRAPERSSSSLFYCGGGQGLDGVFFDFDDGTCARTSTHFLIPPATSSKLLPQETAFIQSIGAFELPNGDVCKALLRCYFRNVHQLLPIIDARALLEEYHENEYANISLLLIWSIFFASSNFAEPELLQKAGYETRKAMKRAFYRRAKALYDCDYEKDKVSLIQSLILLGLWYDDANDRNGAWHWIGIAIGLAQSIGLHRHLRLANSSYPISKGLESIYRRIWWTCFIRDRWLSLATGRPMRINLDDCDVEEPNASDISDELKGMASQIYGDYLPYGADILADLWLQLLKISSALGAVLTIHYKVGLPRPSLEDFQKSEDLVESSRPKCDKIKGSNPQLEVFVYQLTLFYEATVLVLFRPYLSKCPLNADAAVQDNWQRICLQKVRSAAANTSQTLERLLEMDLVRYMKSMAITSIVPAMQIYLLDCKSPNFLTQRFAKQKLEVCMLAMSHLRQTYWGANFMLRLFQKAGHKASVEFGSSCLCFDDSQRGPTGLEPILTNGSMLAPEPSNSTIYESIEARNSRHDLPHLSNNENSIGDNLSLGDESDATLQWLLNSEDFTSLFFHTY
ncbi:fungal-specific transcription factor domain-containing protein [Aspergillus insuetus]